MKHLHATMAILLLSGGLSLAQGVGGATGPTPGASGITFVPANPSIPPQPWAPVGVPPGVNPSNSQDLTYRTNPQDLTLPGAGNTQDLVR
jgi:hypothetical protein